VIKIDGIVGIVRDWGVWDQRELTIEVDDGMSDDEIVKALVSKAIEEMDPREEYVYVFCLFFDDADD
jgi:hypothetical protein